MNAEFNWWLLIVGLVAGGGLVWLVLADWSRRDEDETQRELEVESAWIAEAMRDRGEPVDPQVAEDLLRLHRTWLSTTMPRDDDWPPIDADEMEPEPEATDESDREDQRWPSRLLTADSGIGDATAGPAVGPETRDSGGSIRTDLRPRSAIHPATIGAADNAGASPSAGSGDGTPTPQPGDPGPLEPAPTETGPSEPRRDQRDPGASP
ncbi:MAG TPA: hypothetical protein VNF73_16605 [Candidatus Saccharimonadales bacterium]|nr:hypothetical protein [Candidatus Saccharimonadales bacterium]